MTLPREPGSYKIIDLLKTNPIIDRCFSMASNIEEAYQLSIIHLSIENQRLTELLTAKPNPEFIVCNICGKKLINIDK